MITVCCEIVDCAYNDNGYCVSDLIDIAEDGVCDTCEIAESEDKE